MTPLSKCILLSGACHAAAMGLAWRRGWLPGPLGPEPSGAILGTWEGVGESLDNGEAGEGVSPEGAPGGIQGQALPDPGWIPPTPFPEPAPPGPPAGGAPSAPSPRASSPGAGDSQANCPRPPYPEEALALGIEGSLEVQVEVQADGTVGKVWLLRSSGSPVLDRCVLEWIPRRWGPFQPMRDAGGLPVEGQSFRRRVRFSLSEP